MIMQHDKYMVLRLRNIIAWVNKIVMNIMTRNKQICRQIHCVGALSNYSDRKVSNSSFLLLIKLYNYLSFDLRIRNLRLKIILKVDMATIFDKFMIIVHNYL